MKAKTARGRKRRKIPRRRRRRGYYSTSHIVREVSRICAVKPTKTFRRQIEVALRRGVTFGILVKSGNKYKFDPESSVSAMKRRWGKKSMAKRQTRVRRQQQPSNNRRSQQNQGTIVPRPTVPPPPNWQVKPRNLLDEPITKVIKSQPEK
ncbi:uncharacterized protein LOC111644055 [Copidosoma floridanum]|uniref:uncharacterized protein LOC111644055 n=1 Tax=Copidosoma floridanum TaxID=29053 RepID=UPI000C6F6931|nr:uncharacterized protein LOC111644055 [Copidosoma floridanum]